MEEERKHPDEIDEILKDMENTLKASQTEEEPKEETEEESEEKERAPKAGKFTWLIVAASVAAFLLLLVLIALIPGVRYGLANRAAAKENYSFAQTLYAGIINYKDSAEKYVEIDRILQDRDSENSRQKGLVYLEEEDWEKAEKAFLEAGDYENCAVLAAFAKAKQEPVSITLYKEDEADRVLSLEPELLQLSYDAEKDVLSFNEESVKSWLEEQAKEINRDKVDSSWTQEEEDSIKITVGTDGISLDTKLIIRKIAEAVQKGELNEITAGYNVSPGKKISLASIVKEVCTEPVNAEYDPETHTAKEGHNGYSLDEKAAEAVLAKAKPGESVTIPLTVIEPVYDKDSLDGIYFSSVIGEYTTKDLGNSNRATNIKLAAQAVNGVYLNPGEVFSFNDVVGERTTAKGYKPAGAYSGGKSVQEVGGGICQVSSTIYNAALLANLAIVQRSEHCYPSAYCPLGMDATVSWGGPHFRFRNSSEYPIKIEAEVVGDSITVRLIGTDDGVHVEMTYEVLSVNEYETKTTTDPEEVNEIGHTGYSVVTYRHVYDDATGKEISCNVEAYSTYSRQDIVKLEEKPEDPENPEEPDPQETPTEPGEINPNPNFDIPEPEDPEDENIPMAVG